MQLPKRPAMPSHALRSSNAGVVQEQETVQRVAGRAHVMS